VARAVYRAAPAARWGDSAAEEVAAEEVAWPQQPAAEVRRLYYVAVGEPGYVEGIRASTRPALWCELGLRCRRLLPAVFAGWARRDGGGSRGGDAAVRYAVSPATRYG